MTNTKTFRLFISSTFSDFKKEREVLQTKVFPKIKEYASEQGYTFQPIDLRWGVSHEAQLDQKTLELCLSEVRACKTYLHPNFLIMIGDRYGWVPLPYAIEQKEFEILLPLINKAEDKQLLQEWYKLDLNQLPASYILKEREDRYIDYDTWAEVENTLRDTLQTAVESSNLNAEQKRKYFLSATEAEVEEGIIPYVKPTTFQEKELLSKDARLLDVDPEHIFGFFRDVDKSTQVEDKFIMGDYEQAQAFKKEVSKNLSESNKLHIQTNQKDKKTLEESYLKEFETRVYEFLKSQIDTQKQEESQTNLTPLEIELQTQSFFAQNKRKDFLETKPLKELLNAIESYIAGNTQEPLIIYGASGRGKSSLMAKAIEQAEESLQSKVLYRFVGATPNASSSKEILISMFDELGIDVRSEDEKESFEDFSQRIQTELMSLDKKITLFIDAVDQLGNDEQFLWLPRRLPQNLKIIISALDDANYKEDTRYFTTLKSLIDSRVEIPAFSDPVGLLKSLLEKEDRTLTQEQQTYFLEQFSSASSPLYVSIASQEIKNWKSSDSVEGKDAQKLAQTNKGIIQEFITNLSKVYHHNEKFVQKVLGYIYASRDGLSEAELLALISSDEAFVEMMAPETFHENPTKELPMVHWSRLHTQFKPFLSSKTQDGEELMYFFHREFEDVIRELPTQKEEHEAIINATQKLIEVNQYKPFDDNRWGKLYIGTVSFFAELHERVMYKVNIEETYQQTTEYSNFLVDLSNKYQKDIYAYSDSLAEIQKMKIHLPVPYIINYILSKNLYNLEKMLWCNEYTFALVNLSQSVSNELLRDKFVLDSLKVASEVYNRESNTQTFETLVLSFKSAATVTMFPNKKLEYIEKALTLVEFMYENYSQYSDMYIELLLDKVGITLNNYDDPFSRDFSDDGRNQLNSAFADLTSLGELISQQEVTSHSINFALLLAKAFKLDNDIDNALDILEGRLESSYKLYQSSKVKYADQYAHFLNDLGLLYKANDSLEKSLEYQQKNVAIKNSQYTFYPLYYAYGYASSLSNFLILKIIYGDIDEAYSIAQEIKFLSKKHIMFDESFYKYALLYIERYDYIEKLTITFENVESVLDMTIGGYPEFSSLITQAYKSVQNKKIITKFFQEQFDEIVLFIQNGGIDLSKIHAEKLIRYFPKNLIEQNREIKYYYEYCVELQEYDSKVQTIQLKAGLLSKAELGESFQIRTTVDYYELVASGYSKNKNLWWSTYIASCINLAIIYSRFQIFESFVFAMEALQKMKEAKETMLFTEDDIQILDSLLKHENILNEISFVDFQCEKSVLDSQKGKKSPFFDAITGDYKKTELGLNEEVPF